jgi:hypothetical protein
MVEGIDCAVLASRKVGARLSCRPSGTAFTYTTYSNVADLKDDWDRVLRVNIVWISPSSSAGQGYDYDPSLTGRRGDVWERHEAWLFRRRREGSGVDIASGKHGPSHGSRPRGKLADLKAVVTGPASQKPVQM